MKYTNGRIANRRDYDSEEISLPCFISQTYEESREKLKQAAWAYLNVNGDESNAASVYNVLYGKANEKATQFRFKKLRPEVPKCRHLMSDVPSSEHLKQKCEAFFKDHGLIVKVRRLPVDYIKSGSKEPIRYPSYHFISRQRRHMFEQLMRCRTFLDTRYNSCNEMRNSKSPFSLFELHSNILNHLHELMEDLNDPEFSGLHISLSTRAFTTNTEFGCFKRTKVVAWAIVELLTSNERCLKCLWVHPLLCATSTTAILSALLPYVIYVSFCVGPAIVDERYPYKMFYVWLNDFDMFPRQALILLTSMERFGLVKHYDRVVANGQGQANFDFYSDVTLSHADAGIQDEECFCYAHANWDEIDQVIVACSYQLVQTLIPKWSKLVPDETSLYLLKDLENLLLPCSKYSQRSPESFSEIRIAEFTGLEHTQVRDLMIHLYGQKWKYRLKIKTIKTQKNEGFDFAFEMPLTNASQREERRRRRTGG
ncbi:hypothetical protein BdWA1_000356 [Babesia duncani]|uniref:Uncharacterized protein n=1 Tax=Babesia duncani TaxID=323732 RepID=A0AAD9PMY0_9APIC|nr:hypothetical protein BdWA1_000356 [Babesia duncani]